MAETNDDVLVQQVRAGRLGAFDQLMLRYQKLVCKVAMTYVKDRQSGLDVTQNVFLKAYSHIDRVRAEGMFKPWLLRITYNESINWLRRQKHYEGQEELDEFSVPVSSEAGQERRVLRREDEERVVQGMDALNPKYKLAVALRYAEGMRIKEIAHVMGCSEGMVKSLLFRGVNQIRSNVARSD